MASKEERLDASSRGASERLSPAFWQTVKERRGDELPAGEDEIDRIFSDERM